MPPFREVWAAPWLHHKGWFTTQRFALISPMFNLVSSTLFGLINLWIRFFIFIKFHLQWFFSNQAKPPSLYHSCMYQENLPPFTGLKSFENHKLSSYSQLLFSNFSLNTEHFLPNFLPDLPCLQPSVKDSWIIQHYKAAVSTLGSALPKVSHAAPEAPAHPHLPLLGHIQLPDHFFLLKNTSNFY